MAASAVEHDYAELRLQLLRAVARVCPAWLAAAKEDLVQVAILRLYELERRSEEPRRFSASYIRKVAYSALVDEIRRRRRRPEAPIDGMDRADSHPDPNPGPIARAFGAEVSSALRECLGRLLTDRRMAVTLNLQGHTIPEAADILGWPTKRTENLTYRGIRDLRSCLEEQGITP